MTIRAKLIRRGMRLGALYRPLNNLWLNKVYLKPFRKPVNPCFLEATLVSRKCLGTLNVVDL